VKKKLLSIVVPVFNEENNITIFYERISTVYAEIEGSFELEIVFSDNHSTDNTFNLLKELASIDKRVKVIRFSKNFGFQNSILAAYRFCKGDIAIQLDVDLQDPPEHIPGMIAKWNSGYQVVYGIRVERKEGFFITLFRRIFYRLINLLSEDDLPHDAGDFRLIDRSIINEIKTINDATPYLRGSISSLGFSQIGFEYSRHERERGESKFNFSNLLSLALDGILNHSIIPLKLGSYIGILSSIIMIAAIIVYTLSKFFLGYNWPPGFATTTVLILFSISINCLLLGIIGEYIGRIYKQSKFTSNVIIQETINI
jgi:glycosyltransferase involved in cell wall biosynthesis